jgi:hypothetical protein
MGPGLGEREILFGSLSRRGEDEPADHVADPMSALRIILGDQLSREMSSLRGLDSDRDVVLMM